MQLRDLVREWLQKAQQDMDSACFLSGMQPLPKEIIGFHCQQALEKCLKAILVLQDSEPPRSHDLLFLKAKCQSYPIPSELNDNLLSRLNPYAVEHRYPGEATINESNINDDLHQTQRLFENLINYIESKI